MDPKVYPKITPLHLARVEAATRKLEALLVDPRARAALDDLEKAYFDVIRDMTEKAKVIGGMEDVLASEIQVLVGQFNWAMEVVRHYRRTNTDAAADAMAQATESTGVAAPVYQNDDDSGSSSTSEA